MRELSVNRKQFITIADEILSGDHLLRFKAKGSSMEPYIMDGDIVEVDSNQLDSIKVGDIILCSHKPDFLVVHRVIKVFEDQGEKIFITQGDSLNYHDGKVGKEEVLGKVVSVERFGRKIKLTNFGVRMLTKFWIFFIPFIRRMHSIFARLLKRFNFNSTSNLF
jgi:signal peptidase I